MADTTKRYNGFSWIRTPTYRDDPTKSWEERFRALEAHHKAETEFLIKEVRNLAVCTDNEARWQPLYEAANELAEVKCHCDYAWTSRGRHDPRGCVYEATSELRQALTALKVGS